MTDADIESVLILYESKLEFCFPLRDDLQVKLSHAKEMIPKMRDFIKEGRRDKAFRWLGFLQGIFYSLDIYTIPEMADHNRSPESSN